MAAELRDTGGSAFAVDIECGIDEDWGGDATGAGVRLAEHNEAVHPLAAAGAAGLPD